MSKTPSNDSFDYRVPNSCQYPTPGSPYERDCGEPAAYYGWWKDLKVGEWLCKLHLDAILRAEEKINNA